jgi:hypothetical protein
VNINSISIQEVLLFMSGGLFFLGLCTFGGGLIILLSRALSRDMHTLTTQSMKLAQKGFTEDVSGLVGNTSALFRSLNDLIQTTKGIGVFLCLLGLSIMVIAMLMLFALDQNLLQQLLYPL